MLVSERPANHIHITHIVVRCPSSQPTGMLSLQEHVDFRSHSSGQVMLSCLSTSIQIAHSSGDSPGPQAGEGEGGGVGGAGVGGDGVGGGVDGVGPGGVAASQWQSAFALSVQLLNLFPSDVVRLHARE